MQEQPTNPAPSAGLFDRISNWFQNAVSIKLLTIGILILLLMIPVSMIKDIIKERSVRQQEVINEVSQKWGYAQTLRGPVLTVPYQVHTQVKSDDAIEIRTHTEFAHFLPEELNYDSFLEPDELNRGIFKVTVYKASTKISGSFPPINFKKLRIAPENILWDQAYLTFGLNDLRSIQEKVEVKWGQNTYGLEPELPELEVIRTGLSTPVTLKVENNTAAAENFQINLKVNGSNGLDFSPLGKVTNVKITSTWPNPTFTGAFLPDDRDIHSEGFEAQWKVLHVNRSIPQQFKGGLNGMNEADFGVDLIMPVQHYSKSMRSAKYAIMFITLTFFTFFFFQVLKKLDVHPVQYLLVGFGLCLFFILLVSLSEHLPFEVSYIIASVSIILLITLYTQGMFSQWNLTGIMAGILTLLYVFLYILLQSQDFALLMGSVGLFAALALVMYLTRNVDWYNISKKKTEVSI